MRMRYFFAGFGLLFAIAVAAVGPSGVPSFLRLQALGVNTNVPAAGVINAATDVQVAGVTLTGQGTNASNISSGTLNDARLSANVPLKNSANTFTAIQTINNPAAAGGGNYGLFVVGNSGAARDIALLGETGFSNGLTVQYNGTSMVYTFSDATATTTFSGAISANTGSVGGSAICVANGTNCPAAGKAPIICTAGGACSVTGMSVGQTAIAVKNSATSRSSNTTPTADPDLQFSNVPNGTYSLQLHVEFSEAATNTQGIQYGLTKPTNVGALTGTCTISGTNAATAQILQIGENINTSYTQAIATGSNTYMECQAMLTPTGGPGTVSFNWAQAVSSANATTVGNLNSTENTSFFTLTRLL